MPPETDHLQAPHRPHPRSWQPNPFIRWSVGLHLGAAAWIAAQPEAWPWVASAVAADQAVLSLAGLWPRSRLLGPNWTRLPPPAAERKEIALTFDDGPDPETTPRVLDLLDEFGARASFFCIGAEARRHPALCREIVRRGHSVENHSQLHRWDFAFSGYRGFCQEIAEAQATLAGITGQAPRFFRAPFGIRNPLLEPALAHNGLQLASWTRRGFDTREGQPETVIRRLTRQLAAGDILLLHDGHAARTADGEAVVLRVLPRFLEHIQAASLGTVTLPQALA
jgi:peptidoglycan/xylan/chitin deacetylase (PgdA/CDA1 family)